MARRNLYKRVLCLLLSGILAIGLTACASTFNGNKLSSEAKDLTKKGKALEVEGKDIDDTAISAVADFSMHLFQNSVKENDNSMISPLSVLLALSMTANGADGDTRKQMEDVLGGSMQIEELNAYLHAFVKKLPDTEKAKLAIANSIWFRDDAQYLDVNEDFLEINKDYYGADIYSAPFDEQTRKDINAWVSMRTEERILNILEEIPEDAVMYLINAVAFDAEWQKIYTKDQISEGTFTDISGNKKDVEMMHSKEGKYIETQNATGFVKPYAKGYSFVALLPNEGLSINEYIKNLDGAAFVESIKQAQETSVIASIPKFSYEYDLEMSEVLQNMGMSNAFDSNFADFSKLGTSQNGNIYINRVLHKTYISVDEKGTKAGAATVVEMISESAMMEQETVTLDRPFVYAVVENDTSLPVFVGTVMDIGQ